MTKKDPLLLETIKIEEGKIHNLLYHQRRCNESRLKLFNLTKPLMLEHIIQPPPTGLYRCRIVYNQTIQSIEYIPYKAKEIHRLKVVPSFMNYAYKFKNRDTLNALLMLHPNVDDIIIEKNGYLTDTTIANIAFYDGVRWFTPDIPLLKGTIRAKLLDEGFLHTKPIKKEDLSQYTHVALMNAMIGFKILKQITISDKKGNTYDY